MTAESLEQISKQEKHEIKSTISGYKKIHRPTNAEYRSLGAP